jgi:hypothetical protein
VANWKSVESRILFIKKNSLAPLLPVNDAAIMGADLSKCVTSYLERIYFIGFFFSDLLCRDFCSSVEPKMEHSQVESLASSAPDAVIQAFENTGPFWQKELVSFWVIHFVPKLAKYSCIFLLPPAQFGLSKILQKMFVLLNFLIYIMIYERVDFELREILNLRNLNFHFFAFLHFLFG